MEMKLPARDHEHHVAERRSRGRSELKCATHAQQLATPELRLRLTIGLEKRDGRWTITHEHHSFADPT